MNIYADFIKLKKVVDSCETRDHYKCASNYIKAFRNNYKAHIIKCSSEGSISIASLGLELELMYYRCCKET